MIFFKRFKMTTRKEHVLKKSKSGLNAGLQFDIDDAELDGILNQLG